MSLVLASAAAVLASLAVLALPGLPLALGLRLHPLARAALLAPLSVAVVSIAAEGADLLGIPWSPLVPLLLGLILGAPLLALRRREVIGRIRDLPGRIARSATALAMTAGLLLGGVIMLVRALTMMGGIDQVSQTYDAVFHLNAIRWILDHESASAWTVGSMTALPGAPGTFYPAGWHQLASLVTVLSGGDIVLACNVLMLVLAIVVWPLGVLALVRLCTSSGNLGLFLAGALAGISPAFPLMLMSWGIVWPNFLSTVLLPPLILLGAHLVGLVPRAEERIGLAAMPVLFLLSGLALGLAHPQGIFALLVLAVPIAAWAVLAHASTLLRARRARVRGPRPDREEAGRLARALVSTRGQLLRAAGTAAILLAASIVIWPRFRPSQESSVWGPYTDHTHAFLEAISLAGTGGLPGVAVGTAMVAATAGLLLRGQGRWLLPAFAASSALFMASAAMWDADLRYELTGNWYSDTFRIAAIPVVVGIPLLAAGLDGLMGSVRDRLGALRPTPAEPASTLPGAAAGIPGPLALALSLGLVLAITAGTVLGPAGAHAQHQLTENWTDGELLTADERALLELIPDHVPEDAVIAVNPWNGGALAYAISDRQVLNRFMGFQAEPEVHLLNRALDEAQEDPEVCDAAAELDVRYALDFGPRELFGKEATYVGLNEITTSGAAEVIAQVGEARLLRMSPCRGTDGSMRG
ncbi:DUF6541 family protein [Brachybacterium hainanense]|uniref:DUF6541 family protein n=1 Tax=Brachybacterium hainanense TaxID=1541174 RepID=A0ABV6RI62_9MICO